MAMPKSSALANWTEGADVSAVAVVVANVVEVAVRRLLERSAGPVSPAPTVNLYPVFAESAVDGAKEAERDC